MSKKDEGVRNLPEVTHNRDMRYDIFGSKTKRANHLLYRKDRPIRDLEMDEEKIMKLEVIKSKLVNVRKYKTDNMMITRAHLKKYVNSYGFYMSKDLPDAINTIVMKMVEEAIGRVYCLPGRMERITVRPSDLPLLLQ